MHLFDAEAGVPHFEKDMVKFLTQLPVGIVHTYYTSSFPSQNLLHARYLMLNKKITLEKQESDPYIPKYKTSLFFAGQQLITLTMIYSYNMSKKLV